MSAPPRVPAKAVTTLSDLCKMTGTDKGDAADELKEHMTPIPGPRGATLYDLREAIRVLTDRKRGQSASDDRNLAQAEKIRVETMILEGKWRPVEELQSAIAAIGGAVTRAIEDDGGLSADGQERVAQAVVEAMSKFKDDE